MISEWYLIVVSLLAQNVSVLGTNRTKNKEINEMYLQNIINNMDPNVDPCEDFFGYACGNWARNYNSTDYVDMAGFMDYKVNQQLLQLLEQRQVNEEDNIYEKLYQYYESCEKELLQPALNSFLRLVQAELNITWPIFRENWNKPWLGETDFNWVTTIAGLRWYGLNGVFITQNINARLYNGSHHLVEIYQHQNSYVLREEDVAEIFINFGMTELESSEVTGRIMALERSMRNLIFGDMEVVTVEEGEEGNDEPDEEIEAQQIKQRKESHVKENAHERQPTEEDKLHQKQELTKNKHKHFKYDTIQYDQNFKEFTLAELHSRVSFIDWEKYLNIILGRSVNVSTDVVQMYSLNFKYYEELRTTLAKSSNETIAYYIMLKFMYHLNEHLPLANTNNSQKCIGHLRGYMPLAMNYIYEEHFYKFTRNQTDTMLFEMYLRLTQSFKKLVLENHLQLNTTEQNYVLEELEAMQLKIGNIPRQLTGKFVSDYYNQLQFNSSSFYQNHMQLLRHHTQRQLELLENRAPSSDMHFYHHEPEIARSSSPVKIFSNAILLPYGYLQMPFYHSELHPLFQHSLMGFILAHEIVHAFDLFHIVYDKQSNYNRLGLCVSQHFWPYLDCMVGEVDNLSENIADVAGLRLAYQTYFEHVMNNLDAEVSYGVNTTLTSKQLFFVNSVQFLCANMEIISNLDLRKLNLEHEMHDARVRQNWPLFEEYTRAFRCEKESEINSRRTCRLW